jgi:hypothetical protein
MHRVGVFVVLMLASGCGGYTASYRQIAVPSVFANRTAAQVEMFLGAEPTRPWQNVSIVTARPGPDGVRDTGAAINLLSQTAADMHLDGVHTIRCAGPGERGWGTCEGVGYVYVNGR